MRISSSLDQNPTLLSSRLTGPKALNALNSALISELNEAMEEADADSDIGALVLTGSERAFAGSSVLPSHGVSHKLWLIAVWFRIAGADIKEMKDKTFSSAYTGDFLGNWARISQIRKPVIAAVSGYAVRSCFPVSLCLFRRTT